jgi:hypothetical protein
VNLHEISGHDPADAVLSVGQHDLHIGGLARRHFRQQLFGDRVVEILQCVGGGAGIHFLEDIGGALLIHPPDQIGHPGIAHLLQHLSGGLVVERGDNRGTLVERECVDDARQIDRVQLGQSVVRDI